MVTIIQDREQNCYRIPWDAESNSARFRADLIAIRGWRRNDMLEQWEVPIIRTKEMRALYWRHTKEDYGEPASDLWEHQHRGVMFGLNNPSVLYDMWMGTGKTRTAIELAGLRRVQNVMILGPLSALGVWREQLRKFARFPYRVMMLDNAKAVRVRAEDLRHFMATSLGAADARIVLINYEAIWREPLGEFIQEDATWDMVIADEVHRIKSPGGKLSRFLGRLAPKVPFRVGLSGTPIPHSILDAYGVYRFLQPSIFGTIYSAFQNTYATVDAMTRRVTAWQNVELFREKYNLIRFHAPKEVLQLDEPLYNMLTCSLSVRIWKIYEQLEKEFMAVLEDEQEIAAPNVLVKYLRLQQVESEFVPLEDGTIQRLAVGYSAKQQMLLSFLEDFPREEKLVIFTRFVLEVEQVQDVCEKAGRDYYRLTGQHKELDGWQTAPTGAVLIANLDTGSEAVDCTMASYAIMYSLSYKLREYEQAVARLARPGQRGAPYIYVMIPEGPRGQRSIGRRVYESHVARRSLLDVLLGNRKEG